VGDRDSLGPVPTDLQTALGQLRAEQVTCEALQAALDHAAAGVVRWKDLSTWLVAELVHTRNRLRSAHGEAPSATVEGVMAEFAAEMQRRQPEKTA
jgi:hypothetical protein